MHFRHAKECRDEKALRYEGWKLGISVVLFWVISSVIPVYNKVVFEGVAGDVGFPYPITTAFLQLFFCAVVLTVSNVTSHFWKVWVFWRRESLDAFSAELESLIVPAERSSTLYNNGESSHHSHVIRGSLDEATSTQLRQRYLEKRYRLDDSWIFGPNKAFKLKMTFPIGALFGLKYGVTNWGLHLLPIAPHLLLQATDLAWTVFFARILANERLTSSELITCLISSLGAMLVAYRTNQVIADGLYAISINLISPILLGLCVTTLRMATHRLLVQEAGPNGKTKNMTPFELSALKLWISSLTILPFALVFENDALEPFGINVAPPNNHPAFDFAAHVSPSLGLAAVGGGIFVLLFQVNMTWLSKMASAVTVGMVGGMKVIPQWITAIAFSRSLDLNMLNIVGAAALLISSVIWTYLRYDPILADTRPKYVEKRFHRRRKHSRNTLSSSNSHPRTSSPSSSTGNSDPNMDTTGDSLARISDGSTDSYLDSIPPIPQNYGTIP